MYKYNYNWNSSKGDVEGEGVVYRGSPGLVGLCTHGAVVYMDYMYKHMIGNALVL